MKIGIPVVAIDFILDSVANDKLLEMEQYVICGKTKSKEFSSGRIVGEISFTLIEN